MNLCAQRARGKPLQYLLGSEYFGDIEILCKPGVLIPRPETAASVMYLTTLLTRRYSPSTLRLLDLCTGTGCIPLLFQHEFRKHNVRNVGSLESLGIDVSEKAVHLANENLKAQNEDRAALSFAQADVMTDINTTGRIGPPPLMQILQDQWKGGGRPKWDVLLSNPPYISPHAFKSTTARSVRDFEPKLALVPRAGSHLTSDEARGDAFYPRLLSIADEVEAKVILFEVADMEQALRVARLAQGQSIWDKIEIWRDEPGATDLEGGPLQDAINAQGVTIRGRGNGRSVFAWRGEAARWLGIA